MSLKQPRSLLTVKGSDQDYNAMQHFLGPHDFQMDYEGTYGNQNNGLWKINTDGTGLTHLTTSIGRVPSGAFCPFTQYPWSNFSRDGLLYTDANAFSSLQGGPLTPYTNNLNTRLVGWTTF